MAGIDIGPLHLGGPGPFDDPNKAYPQATITLQQVLDNLPDGVTIYSLTRQGDKGTSITNRAPAPTEGLQPGDTIELRGNGKTWITHVNGDATDVDEPTQTGGTTTPPRSASYQPTAQELAKDPIAAWSKAQAVAQANGNALDAQNATTQLAAAIQRKATEDIAQQKADAHDKLLAQNASDKIRAHIQPTTEELAAYNKLNGTGGGGSGGSEATATQAALSAGAEPSNLAKARSQLGSQAYINYCEQFVENMQGQNGVNPSAISAWQKAQTNGTANPDVSQAKPGDIIYYAAGNDNGGYGHAAIYAGNGQVISATNSGVKQTPISVFASKPLGFVTGGGSLVPTGTTSSDPNNPLAGLGPKEPRPVPTNFGNAANPDWRIYDPGSGKFIPAPGAPTTGVGQTGLQNAQQGLDEANAAKIRQDLLPKSQLAMQQYAQTIDYVKTQLANGTITLDEANNYQQSASSVLNASLQGTTPFELQKLAQEQATQRAQIGKDLIDQKLQSGASLASSLVQSADTGLKAGWGSYNPLTYARLLTDQRAGGPQMDTLAKSLVQALQPNGGTSSPMPGGPMPPSISGLPGQNLSPGPGGLPLLGPALGGAPPPALGSVLPPSPGGTPQTLTPPGMPPPGPTPAPMGWPNPQQTSSDLVAA